MPKEISIVLSIFKLIDLLQNFFRHFFNTASPIRVILLIFNKFVKHSDVFFSNNFMASSGKVSKILKILSRIFYKKQKRIIHDCSKFNKYIKQNIQYTKFSFNLLQNLANTFFFFISPSMITAKI